MDILYGNLEADSEIILQSKLSLTMLQKISRFRTNYMLPQLSFADPHNLFLLKENLPYLHCLKRMLRRPLYTPWRYQKPSSFVFSGGVERPLWHFFRPSNSGFLSVQMHNESLWRIWKVTKNSYCFDLFISGVKKVILIQKIVIMSF